jgi:hypothetical protein
VAVHPGRGFLPVRAAVLDLAAQPVRNLILTPQATAGVWAATGYGSGGSGSTAINAVAGPNGKGALARTWTTIPSAGQSGGSVVSSGTAAGQAANVVPGRTYTAVVHTNLSQALPVCADLLWVDSSGAPFATGPRVPTTAAPNAWERRTVTAVAPAGAVRAQVGGRLTLMDGAVAGLVDSHADHMLVEGSTAPSDYGDGDLPNWAWLGTPRAAASVGYGYLRNMIPNPSYETGGAGLYANTSGVVLTRDNTTAAPGAGAWSYRVTNDANLCAVGYNANVRVKQGDVVTVSVWVKKDAQGTGININAQEWTEVPQTFIRSNPKAYTAGQITAGQWQRLSITATMQAANVAYLRLVVQAAMSEPYNMDAHMTVRGAPQNPYPYRDGDSPGWRWIGTAHASESVGV